MSETSESFYDNFRAQVKAKAEKVKPCKDISQNTLWLKAIGFEAFRNHEGCYDTTVGFTELMVNQLMEFAFDQGALQRDKKSFDLGYFKAQQEMAELIGCRYD